MSAANTNQRIDGKRLWDRLMSMAEIGATPKGGVRRLTLTDVDKRGRDRFRAECEAAGLTVRVDAIGNMFARRAGRDPNRLPVLFGSHLDSQPSGGKFDGALGVLAGSGGDAQPERPRHRHRGAGRTGQLDRRGRQPLRPLADGLRRLGRRLSAGQGVCADRPGRRDGARPRSTASAIAARSRPRRFRPTPISNCISSRARSWSARRSRSASSPARRRRSGTTRCTIGQDSHAGTTPPSTRKDALVCAARIIDLVDRMMRARGEDGRGTVGQLLVLPNSRNVVPGEVRFSVEFRHPSDAEVDRLDAQFPREAAFIARDCGVKLELTHAVQDPRAAVRSRAASIWCGRARRSWAIRRARSCPARGTTRCMSRGTCRRR